MQITAVAASSLLAAGTAVSIRANNIVNATTPGFTARASVYGSMPTGGVAVFAQDTGRPTNLVSETIGLIAGSQQYKAAARLLAADDMLSKTLIKAIA
jgi:flagellar hook-associated protein FlgK